MDVSIIEKLVMILDQHGFAIIVSGALFWYIVSESRANRKTVDGLREVIADLKNVIDDNNRLMTAFTEFIKEWRRIG